MGELPTGTVTFLFSDIEGSTRLLQRLGSDYARVLGEHQALLRAAWADHDGVEIDTQGDGFFVAFPSALAAIAAAAQATRSLAAHAWPDDGEVRVRVGLHTGSPQLVGDRYVGLDVHRAARIAAVGHGGQVLLSETTRALAEHDLPTGAALRDLGAHRLKDLQHAERLYQLVLPGLPADFPPLKSLDSRPHNLPVQPTPLLGREETLATVCALLRHDGVRLVTLTGPGGIGKTRLSIQIAAELVDGFVGGVWFVRLSRLTDSALVVPTIAQTLGLREQGGRPLAETLRDWLRDKRLLLVLDNFEQVVAAAGEVAALLEASPGLSVLVTSRVPLRLRGEHERPLAPLPLPDPRHLPPPDRLSQYAAVALFVERARQARPDFAVTAANAPAIAEICARLDGLPLAIELAASRVRLLPPEALLGRLSSRLQLLTGGARDLEVRQRTMRAAIAWSEGLLGPEERVLFRRLAVFAGGCTLEAAEAVCAAPEGAEPLGFDLLDGLGALVEHSLVQPREEGGEARFGMLHVIREYATERLEASGEAEALQRAHAAYYLALAEEAEPQLRGLDQRAWLDRLEREHDNLRAALGWARERGEARTGLRLAVVLDPFWRVRGYWSEGGPWLMAMLALDAAASGRAVPAGDARELRRADTLRARALVATGRMLFSRSEDEQDQAEVDGLILEGMSTARQLGDVPTVVLALSSLAANVRIRGEVARARALYDEAQAEARRSGDDDALLTILGNFSYLELVSQDASDSGIGERLAEEALALARRLGRPTAEVSIMHNLGRTALRRGDLACTRALFAESLQRGLETGSIYRMPVAIVGLAAVAAQSGDSRRAARLMGAGMALIPRLIGVPNDTERADLFAPVEAARAALGEEAWAAAFAAGRALSLEEAVAEALDESG